MWATRVLSPARLQDSHNGAGGPVFFFFPRLPPLRKQFAKVRAKFFNPGNQVVIRLITALRMSYEESYAKAFPFDKMVSGLLDQKMIKDTAWIVNDP